MHPGGPFWKNNQKGAWQIPKGEFTEDEIPLDAARREFYEETGNRIDGNFIPLSPIKQKGGKTVFAFAVEGDCDADAIKSNEFEIEWPPGSRLRKSFPEIDQASWFVIGDAINMILPGQVPLLTELIQKYGTQPT